ncbi:hypothetical protein F5887DRAFT_1172624 [Amanita rubescens]|nr:hypothetical protein F5887DRAFT_1172624 [Amanita rubescens]
MKEHNFSPSLLRQILTDHRLGGSFYNVQYRDMAAFVGLDPNRNMNDVATFDLYRSRIPTSLFKSIVEDMDLLLLQYGPPDEHETAEATSRFFAPIFNRLIGLFDFAFRNLPEPILDGRTSGKIKYYFEAFGSVAALFIEARLKIGSRKERMDAIAQVIAECDACCWNNTRQGLRVPVFGILCDGEAFQFFFLFDGCTKPFSFSRGTLPGVGQGFTLDDFTQAKSSQPFMRDLRQICEIMFDLLLQSYISSLDAYYQNCFVGNGKEEGRHEWEEALCLASDALEKFRVAETMRQNPDKANATVQDAMDILKRSINKVPIIDKTKLIMSDWDDGEV